MARIYDMATGAIIAGEEQQAHIESPAETYQATEALQSVEQATAIEDMSPVDAYMVMLQDLLKKL